MKRTEPLDHGATPCQNPRVNSGVDARVAYLAMCLMMRCWFVFAVAPTVTHGEEDCSEGALGRDQPGNGGPEYIFTEDWI